MGPMILVVDDMPDARLLLRKILEKKGFNTIEAATGAEALEIIENQYIDLMLLDLMLPDMTGLDIMSKIHEDKRDKGYKVIFISGNNERDIISKAMEMGGDDYLVKPIYPDALVSKVNIILGRNREVENFNKIRCSLKARLQNHDILPDIHIVELTEVTVVLRCTAMIRPEYQITIASDKFDRYLNLQGPYTIKVVECRRESNGKYYVTGRFVGIGEEFTKEVRKRAIQGKFLS